MKLLEKLASAKKQCPQGRKVYYDQDGRIAYVLPKDEAHYQSIGYTQAPSDAPPITPIRVDEAQPKQRRKAKADLERPAKDI